MRSNRTGRTTDNRLFRWNGRFFFTFSLAFGFPKSCLVFIWCLWCKKQGRSRVGSALLLCLLFDRVKNILQDLCGGLICRLDGVCVNLAGGSRICVSQPCRNSCQVRTGGDQQRCVGVFAGSECESAAVRSL